MGRKRGSPQKKERDDKILMAYKENTRVPKIAKTFNLTNQTIYNILRERGIKVHHPLVGKETSREERLKKQRARYLARARTVTKEKLCAICKKQGEIHHISYDEPITAIFLCREHHYDIHLGIFIVS